MNQKITALLRTIIPGAWGTLIGYLVATLPFLAPYAEQINGLSELIVLIAIGGYYALMRKLEPLLPEWVTVILMGSNAEPDYGDSGLDVEQVEEDFTDPTDLDDPVLDEFVPDEVTP